jgi:hypothetical protein
MYWGRLESIEPAPDEKHPPSALQDWTRNFPEYNVKSLTAENNMHAKKTDTNIEKDLHFSKRFLKIDFEWRWVIFPLIFFQFSCIILLPQRHAPQEACPPRRGAGATFPSIACSLFISLHFP